MVLPCIHQSEVSYLICFMWLEKGTIVECFIPLPGLPTTLDWSREGPTALAVGIGGGCLDIFSLVCQFSFLSSPLWEMARYRLKYCLKGPLSPKQPINQPSSVSERLGYGCRNINCWKVARPATQASPFDNGQLSQPTQQ